MKDVKQGDMVWVYQAWRREPQQCEVIKIGRTLVHVDVRGTVEKYQMGGRSADPRSNSYFRTDAEHAESGRRSAAIAILRAAGVEVRNAHSLPLELLEALAEVAKSFTSESEADGRATLTDAGHRALPAGCRCGYVQSRADGHWRLISRRNCPVHSESEAGNE